ncbi:uncharacterized protein B0H18DRAFT_550840 [Fomitopsis serialis]|uniref:uncharacterized protein n=1 Tax=Fomitopsis serialis TaxID=139415 RepID=UPI0020080413|nr:uncharacterized protein B0H18DRAFT_550840 [Neoantrodia serialis]KAH9934279.1 hypothetical protein B0H18DRAFT_550840 [Neoantrodia serialis]
MHVLDNRIIMPDVTIGPADHILDSGTGTGIWLLDAMKVVPDSTVLHGLDIEPGLFPRDDHAVVSRGNVHFHVGSCTALPSDWNSKFKLVNQRHMIAALRKEEWGRSIQEIFRVLEPGGWVQFGEVEYWRAGPETEKFKALTTTVAKAKGLVLDCAVRVPELLRETGFSQISVQSTVIPLGKNGGQLAADARRNWMAVFRGLKTPVLKAGGFGHVSSEADFDLMTDRMEDEWQNSQDAEIQNNVICAQKPLL